MAISDRDFALLQEEVKCLRQKLSNTVGTSGGYTDVLTSPGSSVYPNSYTENCDCVNVVAEEPDATLGSCSTGDDATSDNNLGDMADDIVNTPVGGLFAFDADSGVFYLPPGSSTYQNRNTGLADTTLEHGCKDVWWYRKKSPNEDYTILWIVGRARVMRSDTAGRSGWTAMTPPPPTGTSINNVVFKQIISDPYKQNTFWILAVDTLHQKTWVVSTVDDGVNWNWFDLTNYNSVAHRVGIWMAIGGPAGALLWVTTWGDDQLRVLKLNADNPPTISAEYPMGSATLWDVENYFEILSPAVALDSNKVYLFGRATNPQGLGLCHIISSANEGVSWSMVENTWSDDWCGAIRIGLSDDVYAVRNLRGAAEEPPGDEPYLIGSIVAATGGPPDDAVYTTFGGTYLFDNYGGSHTPLYRASVGIDGDGLPTITGRTVIYNDSIFWPGAWGRYSYVTDDMLIDGWGTMVVSPVGSGTPSVGGAYIKDLFTSDESMGRALPAGFNPGRFVWRTISTGESRAFNLPESGPLDSTPMDIVKLTDNYALGFYKHYDTNLRGIVLYRDESNNILSEMVTVDAGIAVDVPTYCTAVQVDNGVYALFFSSASGSKVVRVSATVSTISFGSFIDSPFPQDVARIDENRVAIAYISGNDYMYATVDPAAGVSTPVVVYSSSETPGTDEIGVGYMGGNKAVVSYLDDSDDLRLASVSV